MNILIIGGGELGSMIADQLISEGHAVTLIEKSEKTAKKLNEELDALVLNGSGIDVNILMKANIVNTELFLALTNDDNVNIVSCNLVKKLSHYKAYTIAKIENSSRYFSNPIIESADFGIDNMIATRQLSINKISDLIAEPETIEIINFHDNDIKIVGIQVTDNFTGTGKKIHEITSLDKTWRKVRIIAVNKDNEVIIPSGNDIIDSGDRIFIIGNTESIKSVTQAYFPSVTKIRKVIILGGNRIGKELARRESELGKSVTIVEEDENICSQLSEDLGNVLIINGSGTNSAVLHELDMKGSFVACVTDRDEQNIISAVLAKRNGAYKAVCNITNIAITPIINEIRDIDSVFSTESLALSEILNYCRKGEILSLYPLPNMKAETMKIKISSRLDILDKPLREIRLPKGMIIGAILRENKIIIPYGNDDIRLDDFVICFIIPSARKAAKELFSKTSGK